MLLKELLEDSSHVVLRGSEDIELQGITADSRDIEPGMAFFCMAGATCDGINYLAEALKKGTVAVIADRGGEWQSDAIRGTEEDWQSSERIAKIISMADGREAAMEESVKVKALEPKVLEAKAMTTKAGEEACDEKIRQVAVILVEDVRRALALASDKWFGHPSRELVTVGITGTKGKTTTTYLIKSILENAGRKVGLIGTNEVIIGRRHLEAGNTTPDALLLQSLLRQMADEGLDTVVMEVSSQALKLHRTDGIFFDYGIFTNLSPDHVAPGEHRDFEEYLECKRRLFQQCRIGIVNGDDPYVARITEGHTCALETFGMKDGNMLQAQNVMMEQREDKLGVQFHVTKEADFDAWIPMPGRFSVYNALAAISLCRHFHVRESDIQRSLRAAKVKGRIEVALVKKEYAVIIDYAHNPMALASLLETLRDYTKGRLICLFGCGGNRPVMRRRMMGRISGEMADLTIVTDDNPRDEDPEIIRAQIAEGVEEVEGDYVVIAGRREAIRYALSQARAGDLIVLAGKGHETYQEIRGQKLPMDERSIIREMENETCNMRTSL